MSRVCPKCKTPVAQEARFCRLCGTPIKAVVRDSAPVSPRAETAPLADEGRTTHGFPGEDAAGSASAPHTSRVRRAEMENLLRTTPAAPGAQQVEEQAEPYAAPETSALTRDADSLRSTEDSTKAKLDKTLPISEAPATQAASVVKNKRGPGALQLAALALLLVAVGATALAFYFSRKSGGTTNGEAPISINDQKRVVEEKLAEAESLLSAGNFTDAISRLRYAVRLDPSNARAHRMLADALERSGNVNEAIEEYRVATQLDPKDEATRLRYADALRRVGRTDEAREIYQALASSSTEEVARTAREKLSQIARSASTTANTEQDEREARDEDKANETAANNNAQQQAGTAPQNVTPAPAANNAGNTGKDPVASYNRAVKIIEGKDIRKMSRAELLLAYELFQVAQKGPNAASASRYLRELDNELFVRRKRS